MFSFIKNNARFKALFAGLVLLLMAGSLFISCTDPDPDEQKIDAQQPSISAQPQGGTWNVDTDNSFPLSVTAAVTDGGSLSHQWYSNTTASTSGGIAIGTDSATLTLAKTDYDAGDILHFYVVVTNTNNSATGKKTASTTSSVATVSLTSSLVNAHHPSISVQPQGGTWNVSSANSFTLSVTADSPDDGELSYQWYKNSANNTDGEEIEDENETTLTLKKADYTGDGDHYFYVAVTNTITENGDGGTKTATTTSSVVKVTISGNGVEAVNAQHPNITAQPTSGFWNIWLPFSHTKNTAHLNVTANSPDSGNLSYQWYVNSSNSTNGSALLTGKTSATLSLTAAEIASTYTTIDNGTNYFYVVVTNTITDNNDGGTKTATTSSTIVSVTVDGVANGIIGYWEPENNGGDNFFITSDFHMTSFGIDIGFGKPIMSYKGYIQYVSFFSSEFGIIIVKYDEGEEQEWYNESDNSGDYFGIYIENYDPGVSWGITNTSDGENGYISSETQTLEAAINRFDETAGNGRWFVAGLTPTYLFRGYTLP